MTISDLVPNLQPMVEDLSAKLRFLCYFVFTSSIMVKAGRGGGRSIGGLVRPIVSAIILTGIIATLPFWFNLVRDEFWNIAVGIRKEFTGSVAGTGAALLQLISPPKGGINWLDVGNSIMKALQYAIGWAIVWVGGLVQLPMMIGQFVMECLCYLFLPVAISLFSFESTKGLAIRYVQQTLAILAWPIGFAVVDLVGYSLLTSSLSAVSAGAIASGVASGFTPAKLIIGGIVAVWLILGSLVTPIVMQMLFCSGTPLSSAVGQALQSGLAIAGASRFLPSSNSDTPAASTGKPSEGSFGPPPTPSSSGSSGLALPPLSPLSPAPVAALPLPLAPGGILQTPRGALAIGAVADRIAPEQAARFATQSGRPFTQAFSNGSVVVHQPGAQATPRQAGFLAAT